MYAGLPLGFSVSGLIIAKVLHQFLPSTVHGTSGFPRVIIDFFAKYLKIPKQKTVSVFRTNLVLYRTKMDYLAVVYFHVSLYSANGVAFSEIYAVINYNFTSLDPTFYLLIKTWFAKGEPSTQLSHMLFFSTNSVSY